MFYSAEAIMVYREQYHPCAERLNRDLAAVDSQNLSLAERVGNVLRRQGIAPAPKRCQTTTWKEFIRAHMAVLAGVDFFTVEVLTWRGLATYYVLFFIQLETRRLTLGGVTRHPRMVKVLIRRCDMIAVLNESRTQLGTPAGLHHRARKSGVTASERVPDC
jgi:hypothetical protein